MSTYYCIACPKCQKTCTTFRRGDAGFGAGPDFDGMWTFLEAHDGHGDLVIFSEHDPRYQELDDTP